MSQSTVDELLGKHARVMAAAATSSKVRGLKIAMREMYTSKLHDALYENYCACNAESERIFDKKDVEDCAVAEEYKIFSTTTTFITYRSGVCKLVRLTILISLINACVFLSFFKSKNNNIYFVFYVFLMLIYVF